MGRIVWCVGAIGLWVIGGCSSSESEDGAVDSSGACGVVCEGGELGCTIGGFNPDDGLEACTRACQSEWPNEQDPECVGDASFVLTCVEANQSCDTLDDDTCGVAEDELIDCAMMPSGTGGTGGGGGGGGAPMVDVSVQALSLAVLESCDAGGEGDFFINVRLRDDSGDEPVLIDDDLENLVQSAGGITSLEELDIVAAGPVPAVTGTRVIVSTSMLENDPDGPQVSQGLSQIYEYDADTPCWRLENTEECLGAEGEIDVLVLRLVDNTGDPCDAQLRSRFSAGPPL